MLLQGTISTSQSGLHDSISAMHMQMELLGINNQNIQGFDKVGYQRVEPVVSSFSEYIGIHGISEAVDERVGRIVETNQPLNLAIATNGYFQIVGNDGAIKLTRDGRFKLSEEGDFLGLEGQKVLTAGGTPIKLPFMPRELNDITVDREGKIFIFNPETRKMDFVDKIGVVASDGKTVLTPDIKQNCLEYSNVSLAEEVFEMFPYRKNFDANRQMFRIQNEALSTAIQQLANG